jgi:hypothetical protein
MSDQDPRKLYLISQIRGIFQQKDAGKDLSSHPLLDDFLNSVNVNCLRISKESNSNSLLIEKIDPRSSSSQSQAEGLQVCLSKMRNEEISKENMQQNIAISTINTNPLATLLNNLQNVYLPTLQNQKWADQVDNNIKRLLEELKVGLDNTLSRGGKGHGAAVIVLYRFLIGHSLMKKILPAF